MEGWIRWGLGALALVTIFYFGRLASRPTELPQTPVERITSAAADEALRLARSQLGLELEIRSEGRGDDPLLHALREAGLARLGVSVLSHGAWIHLAACETESLEPSGGKTDISIVSVHFTLGAHGDEWPRSSLDLIDRRARTEYHLASTWLSHKELYRLFPYVLIRKPKSVGEEVAAWVLETWTGRWTPIGAGRQWQPQDIPDETDRVAGLYKIPYRHELPETSLLPFVHDMIDWHARRVEEDRVRAEWYGRLGFFRVPAEVPLREQPLEVSDALELAEVHVNRELVRRFQTDAEILHLRHYEGWAPESLIETQVEIDVANLRHRQQTDMFLRVEVRQGGRRLRVYSYQAPLFLHSSGAYWAVEVGRCDSELGRRLKVLMVGLPSAGAKSSLVWWSAGQLELWPPAQSPWKFAGPVSGGWAEFEKPRDPASFELCDLH